jgi:hypothetical protein
LQKFPCLALKHPGPIQQGSVPEQTRNFFRFKPPSCFEIIFKFNLFRNENGKEDLMSIGRNRYVSYKLYNLLLFIICD